MTLASVLQTASTKKYFSRPGGINWLHKHLQIGSRQGPHIAAFAVCGISNWLVADSLPVPTKKVYAQGALPTSKQDDIIGPREPAREGRRGRGAGEKTNNHDEEASIIDRRRLRPLRFT